MGQVPLELERAVEGKPVIVAVLPLTVEVGVDIEDVLGATVEFEKAGRNRISIHSSPKC